MKKFVTILLAIIIVSNLFVACGENNPKEPDPTSTITANTQETDEQLNEDEPKATPTPDTTTVTDNKDQDSTQNSDVAVGEILDKPEVTFDSNTEKIYVYFISYDTESNNEPTTLEIAFDQITDDTYVIYVTNGLLKLNELIYEVTDSGITKYYKDAFSEKFTKEMTLSQDDLQKEVNSNHELFSLLTIYETFGESVKFRKSDAVVPFKSGDVYVYDLIEAGETTGQIAIDKKTGIMVSFKDDKGNSIFSVQDIKTSDFKIPEYK